MTITYDLATREYLAVCPKHGLIDGSFTKERAYRSMLQHERIHHARGGS